MKILAADHHFCLVESVELIPAYEVIEYAEAKLNKSFLMAIFKQDNPYRAENGRWNYVLKEEPTK